MVCFPLPGGAFPIVTELDKVIRAGVKAGQISIDDADFVRYLFLLSTWRINIAEFPADALDRVLIAYYKRSLSENTKRPS
jgi:hypothetical protein